MPEPFRPPTCTCTHTAGDHTSTRNLVVSAPAVGRCLIDGCSCTAFVDDWARAAYERDQQDKDRMLVLRRQIREFLTSPPERSSVMTRDVLGRACEALETDSQHVVEVWE